MLKNFKSMLSCVMVVVIFLLAACGGDDSSSAQVLQLPELSKESVKMGGFEVKSVDNESHQILVNPTKKGQDTIKLDCVNSILESSGGAKAYLATTVDESDPDIVNWDKELQNGTSLVFGDTNVIAIVILDDKNRVVTVWEIVGPERSASSSSKEISSSSGGESSSSDCVSSSSEEMKFSSSMPEQEMSSSVEESSSSEIIPESSSAELELSSAEESSSSEIVESSSSVFESSASAEKDILAFQFKVDGDAVATSDVVKDDENRTLTLTLKSRTKLSKVQVKRCLVSDNAICSVPLNENLALIEGDDYFTYEFSVTAEDESVNKWEIRVVAPKGILLSELVAIYDGLEYIPSVNENFVYVELDYGADLSKVDLEPVGEFDLRSPVEMQFVDALGNLSTYSVKAGVQLPGSDFTSRNPFWATTSDAMANPSTGDFADLGLLNQIAGLFAKDIDLGAITMASSANLEFDPNAILTTKEITGSFALMDLGIEGHKMAGGFYYTGSFNGINTSVLYNADGGTVTNDDSNFLDSLIIGQPFNGRPVSFDVTYAYEHVKNKNTKYPQKSLIYVALVAEDNSVIAVGFVENSEDVPSTTQNVILSYDADEIQKFIGAGYPIASGLRPAENSQMDVASIHVMFASSAYAYVASNGDSNWRGGDGAKLIIKELKLNY